MLQNECGSWVYSLYIYMYYTYIIHIVTLYTFILYISYIIYICTNTGVDMYVYRIHIQVHAANRLQNQ